MGASTSRVAHPDHTVKWYRTKLPSETRTELHRVSDVKGAIQTGLFLGMLCASFGLSLHYYYGGQQMFAAVFVSLYGMQANFMVNGMHELGHGFVFRTKWLNGFFMRIISFLGWLHPDMFFSSHLRHHRYTQNFPYDQENPMPCIPTWWAFASFGLLNIKGCYEILEQTVRVAAGIYPTKHLWWTPAWEDVCYPPHNPAARAPPQRWAIFLLAGHSAIALLSIARGVYLIPLLVSLGPFYNGWLFFLCNSTQHVGMHHGNGTEKTVEDFRLSARSFHLSNPIVRCWYWHMNYHIEHHMYAAVPCYNLANLHKAIQHDLPPTPNGLIAVWKEIIPIIQRQAQEPTYVAPVHLPGTKRK